MTRDELAQLITDSQDMAVYLQEEMELLDLLREHRFGSGSE